MDEVLCRYVGLKTTNEHVLHLSRLSDARRKLMELLRTAGAFQVTIGASNLGWAFTMELYEPVYDAAPATAQCIADAVALVQADEEFGSENWSLSVSFVGGASLVVNRPQRQMQQPVV